MKGLIWRRVVTAVALISLWAGSAVAASLPISFTFEVVSVDAGVTEIAVGDRFTMDFVIEDSTVDVAAGVGGGQFPGLLNSFDMTADPGNAGSWTPSGTYSAVDSNFVTNAFGDNLTLQIRGAGYPDGGTGLTFHDFDLGFGWPPGIDDSGSGDTFAQQLGGTFAVPPAVIFGASIRFTDGQDFPAAQMELVQQVAPVAVPSLNFAGAFVLMLFFGLFAATILARRA